MVSGVVLMCAEIPGANVIATSKTYLRNAIARVAGTLGLTEDSVAHALEKSTEEQATPRVAPDHAAYADADPDSFPRYIVSFFGGGNALVSRELYEAYEGITNTHRHIQHCSFPGCNDQLRLNGELLPEFKTQTANEISS